MHIGFATSEYVLPGRPSGGIANYLRKTGIELARRGHHVTILLIAGEESHWQDQGLDIWQAPKMVVRRRVRGSSYLDLFAQYLSARRLARLAWSIHRAAPFDLLHSTSYRTPGLALIHNHRVPLVSQLSSSPTLIRQALQSPNNRAARLSDEMEAHQVLGGDQAYALSRLVADDFASRYGRALPVLLTPLEPIPTEQDDSYYRKTLEGKSYLLFFGTLNRIKGADLLAGALPGLLSARPDLHIVFAGTDQAYSPTLSMWGYISSRAQEFPGRVHSTGLLEKAQLYPLISHALGVILPSRTDNYPNTCLEALAAGVPVVGTYGSSLDEIITDGKTGFLARNDDVASLNEAIERLLALCPDERRQMQADIHAAVQAMLSDDRIGQMEAFFEAAVRSYHAGDQAKGSG